MVPGDAAGGSISRTDAATLDPLDRVERIRWDLRDGAACTLGVPDVRLLHSLKGSFDRIMPGWWVEDSGPPGTTSARGLQNLARRGIAIATAEVFE